MSDTPTPRTDNLKAKAVPAKRFSQEMLVVGLGYIIESVPQLERELAEAKFDLQFRRDLYALQSKELAKAREEISDLQGDVEAWKRETMIANARLRGEKHPDDNGAISPKEIIPKLQRELAEAREQRSKLAEAMTEYMNFHIQHGFVTTAETIKAWQALVAVKGGLHD